MHTTSGSTTTGGRCKYGGAWSECETNSMPVYERNKMSRIKPDQEDRPIFVKPLPQFPDDDEVRNPDSIIINRNDYHTCLELGEKNCVQCYAFLGHVEDLGEPTYE